MSASAAVRNAKAALRKEIKLKLSTLTENEKERQSKIVTEKLLQLKQIQSSQRISLYLSMTDEIRTLPLLRQFLDASKECFIPHYSGPTMKMVKLKSWQDYQDLPETKWKIKQPSDNDIREDALDTGGLDVIIMPGLGFSPQGARLGRGKGYYDSYLQKCKDKGYKPFTVAMAFTEQMYDTIPTDTNDINIDVVLFPDKMDTGVK